MNVPVISGATVAPMTFSIVARSADGTAWGVAVASKFLGVGSAVPAAVAGVGAVATQASANVAFKPVGALADGRGRHRRGRARADDRRGRGPRPPPGRHRRRRRQRGVATPGPSAWTGPAASSRPASPCRATSSSAPRWSSRDAGGLGAPPTRPLPWATGCWPRCAAGDDAGGDRRGRQSAALLRGQRGRRLRRRRRHRGRPARRRPPRPVRRAGPARRPARPLPDRVDRRGEGRDRRRPPRRARVARHRVWATATSTPGSAPRTTRCASGPTGSTAGCWRSCARRT